MFVIEILDERKGWVQDRNRFKTEGAAKLYSKSVAKKSNIMTRVIELKKDGPDEIVIAYSAGNGRAIY